MDSIYVTKYEWYRPQRKSLSKANRRYSRKLHKNKLNTIIIHIRPNGDSLYPSKYFPWSDIISGTQGKNPSYNPLKYIIISSHKKNIKVHAWINPLRIRFSQTPSALSSDNPYTIWQNDDNEENNRYTFQSGKNIYYNPAYSEVRELIINGVREIIENYEVDGIHFDDYFYPEDDMKCDEVDYKNISQQLMKIIHHSHIQNGVRLILMH